MAMFTTMPWNAQLEYEGFSARNKSLQINSICMNSDLLLLNLIGLNFAKPVLKFFRANQFCKTFQVFCHFVKAANDK